MVQAAAGQAREEQAQPLHTSDNPMYNMRRTSLSECSDLASSLHVLYCVLQQWTHIAPEGSVTT